MLYSHRTCWQVASAALGPAAHLLAAGTSRAVSTTAATMQAASASGEEACASAAFALIMVV